MSLLMKKDEKSTPIEQLLNKIYLEPDLSKEVFEYVAPYALKAYETISLTSAQNTSLFANHEAVLKLESILTKNLPKIIDIYSKLPLEYRNKEKLKTGKTHRETLLDSIHVLVQTMKEIDKELYSELDTEALVHSRVISEQYGTAVEFELEHDSFDDLKTSFNLNDFQKNNPNFSTTTNRLPEDNTIIKVVSGQVEYKVKNKMKHFMAGVYNTYNSASEKVKSVGSSVKYFISDHTFGISTTSGIIVFIMVLSAGVHITNKRYAELIKKANDVSVSDKKEDIQNHDTVIPKENKYPNYSQAYTELKEIEIYIAASSKGLLDINMQLLEKYSKTHSNFKAKLVEHGETIQIDMKADKKECLNFIDDVNQDTNFGQYRINKVDVVEDQLITDEVADIACEVNNNIRVAYWAKRQN